MHGDAGEERGPDRTPQQRDLQEPRLRGLQPLGYGSTREWVGLEALEL